MSANFLRDREPAIDYASSTFLKNDLRNLNEKIANASTQVNSQYSKPFYLEGKDGDFVTCSNGKTFKKMAFPTLLFFPEFNGTVRYFPDPQNPSQTFTDKWNSLQSGDILELTADITLTSSYAISSGNNILIRSTPGSKFTINFTETAIGVLPALFYGSSSRGLGLSAKDVIFKLSGAVTTKSIFSLGSALLNPSTLYDPSSFPDCCFLNCDFYFGKYCFSIESFNQNFQFDRCNFYNISASSGECRAFYISGIKNLFVSKSTITSLGTSSNGLFFIQFTNHNLAFRKVTGDVFLDGVIDNTTFPNTIRHVLQYEQPSDMIFTRKTSLYMKDCVFKHAAASYISVIGTGAAPLKTVFENFQDIVLFGNTYQNNIGKGLFHWDQAGTQTANLRSGVVTGQEYSIYNNAVQNNYFRPDSTNSQILSLLTGTASAQGENQHWTYNLRGGSGTIQLITLDSWTNSSRWIEQIPSPFYLNGRLTLAKGTADDQTSIVIPCSYSNFDSFQLTGYFRPRTSGGLAELRFAYSIDGGLSQKQQNLFYQLSKTEGIASGAWQVSNSTFETFTDGMKLLGNQNDNWGTKVTIRWSRPVSTADWVIFETKALGVVSAVGFKKTKGEISTAQNTMPTHLVFFTNLTTTTTNPPTTTITPQNISGKWQLDGLIGF